MKWDLRVRHSDQSKTILRCIILVSPIDGKTAPSRRTLRPYFESFEPLEHVFFLLIIAPFKFDYIIFHFYIQETFSKVWDNTNVR